MGPITAHMCGIEVHVADGQIVPAQRLAANVAAHPGVSDKHSKPVDRWPEPSQPKRSAPACSRTDCRRSWAQPCRPISSRFPARTRVPTRRARPPLPRNSDLLAPSLVESAQARHRQMACSRRHSRIGRHFDTIKRHCNAHYWCRSRRRRRSAGARHRRQQQGCRIWRRRRRRQRRCRGRWRRWCSGSASAASAGMVSSGGSYAASLAAAAAMAGSDRAAMAPVSTPAGQGPRAGAARRNQRRAQIPVFPRSGRNAALEQIIFERSGRDRFVERKGAIGGGRPPLIA